MKLIIVESPTKRNRIQALLGPEILVIACHGQIRELPNNSLGIELGAHEQVRMNYVMNEMARDRVIPRIRAKSSQAKEIILATDPDADGEALAWHIMRSVGPHAYSRARFRSLTKEAVMEGIACRGQLDQDLVDAHLARRAIDRYFGFFVSSLYQKSLGMSALSVGRAQSVAVRLVAEREDEIKTFVKSLYHEVWTTLQLESGGQSCDAELIWFKGKPLERGFPSRVEADAAMAKITTYSIWHVLKRTQKLKSRETPPPYTTSTMYQDALNRLNIPLEDCMQLLQQLYENGAITYYRTDSVTITPGAIAKVRHVISVVAPDLLPERPIAHHRQTPGSEESHEAIRPTDPSLTGRDLGFDQPAASIYDLIRIRVLSSQCIPGEDIRTELLVGVWRHGHPSNRIEDVQAVCRSDEITCRVAGWRQLTRLMPGEVQKADFLTQGPVIPDFKHHSPIVHRLTRVLDKMTRPPKRYTQASLIQRLEKERISRPSTFSKVISAIIERGYVIDEQKNLTVTSSGIDLIKFLKSRFPDTLIDITYNSEIENAFDAIARGSKTWESLVFAYGRSLSERCRELGLSEMT